MASTSTRARRSAVGAAAATPTGPLDLKTQSHLPWRPGEHITQLPKRPRAHHLYGLAIGDDWLTFTVTGEIYSWCTRRTAGAHSGPRSVLEAWIRNRRAELTP